MDLHGRIMNIADKVTTNTNAMAGNDTFIAYKEGHRDAHPRQHRADLMGGRAPWRRATERHNRTTGGNKP